MRESERRIAESSRQGLRTTVPCGDGREFPQRPGDRLLRDVTLDLSGPAQQARTAPLGSRLLAVANSREADRHRCVVDGLLLVLFGKTTVLSRDTSASSVNGLRHAASRRPSRPSTASSSRLMRRMNDTAFGCHDQLTGLLVRRMENQSATHKATGAAEQADAPDRYASAEIRQPRSLRRSPKPYLATAHVPRDANNATTIPDGMIARSLPPLL
jgi:hypothetical protein